MTDPNWHPRERRRLLRLLQDATREDERLYGLGRSHEGTVESGATSASAATDAAD
jgi:hypothetical protein